MQFSGQPSREEFRARAAAAEERMRQGAGALPGYGPVGWSGPRVAGEWEWHDDTLVTVGLAHGDAVRGGPWLHVLTTSLDVAESVVSLRMRSESAPTDPDGLVRRRSELAHSPSDRVEVVVDSVPVDFRLWRGIGRWWIAATHAGHALIVEGRNIELQGLALMRVDDLEPYIAGRRVYLHTLVGED